MFGYITANIAGLDDGQAVRYRSWYCGLCRALKERHGAVSRLTLNYDMTFLVMLLSSVYDKEPEAGSERCAVHPVKKHRYFCNEFSAYAADMNVLLVYHNLMDDWKDDRNVLALGQAQLFRMAGQRISGQYPRQSRAVLNSLESLSRLEKEGELRPDLPAEAFGQLMAELFVPHEDEHAQELRQFGRALGRFIYIMDACMDFDSDLRKMRYNPLAAMTHADFEPTLVMLAAECTGAFERLPVKADRNIMENILYTGMWGKYSAKYIKNPKKDKKEVPPENEGSL